MAPDMSKDEVASIQWPNMKTLKRLLATPSDQKTKTKSGAVGIGAGGYRRIGML
jgi:hypothetical protein